MASSQHSMIHRASLPVAAAAGCILLAGLLVAQSGQPADPPKNRTAPLGYSDTPIIPGQKWKVHDIDRPRPSKVTPGAQYGQPPSDAIVLFDGKDLSKWQSHGRGANSGKLVPAAWKIEKGYMESPHNGTDIF